MGEVVQLSADQCQQLRLQFPKGELQELAEILIFEKVIYRKRIHFGNLQLFGYLREKVEGLREDSRSEVVQVHFNYSQRVAD